MLMFSACGGDWWKLVCHGRGRIVAHGYLGAKAGLMRLFKEIICKHNGEGSSPPSKALLRTHERPSSNHEEEDSADSTKQVCQAFMNMGNQQATKLQPNCHFESSDALLKSQRKQIPRKRRRRAEGLVYTGKLHHNLKMTTGTPQVPLKAKRLTKPNTTSSPIFGEWTSAARGKQLVAKESEEKSDSSQVLKPVWRVKLSDASPASSQKSLSKKSPLFSRKIFSSKQESSPHDSDTELSEYDNDVCSRFSSDASDGAKSSKATSQTHEKMKAENVEMKSTQEAAEQRVMGKIEEVERIIRRVSLTSSDWIKDGGEEQDETQMSSLGYLQEHQFLQQKSQAEFKTQSRLDSQGSSCNDDGPLIVEELRILGEALSQSLQQALKMEEWKTKGEEQSHVMQRPLNLPSLPHQFTFSVPDRSLSCSFSPTLSARTCSSLESLSPILSSPLTSSLTNVTDQHEAEISDGHRVWTNSEEDKLVALGPGGCKSTTSNPVGAETDWRHTQKQFSLSDQEYLLSSDEVLQKQEELWQLEVEESLSHCRSLFHPSRPKHVDFLRITAPDDDITETPPATPVPKELRLLASSSCCLCNCHSEQCVLAKKFALEDVKLTG
ncbi:uncharacterized protein LOC121634258 [Melanotaenia boesemani]|uniref:uncharacterized protein LOC121634258 n=1 Tax=Melanotaenia boesemani TaxID=1250792 RepID=UPI001C04CA4F|nr:uncharacterized protein LOC121634258 [Melanotaenia boesemani]